MSDLLLQMGVSNLAIAGGLAGAAWYVQRAGRFPRAAHVLWLLVLVKLVTPSFVTLPVIEFPSGTAADAALPAMELAGSATATTADVAALAPTFEPPASIPLSTLLLWAWALGSAVVLVWSLARIVRFHRVLVSTSSPAPGSLQRAACRIAGRLGLSKAPAIFTANARIVPLVWWVGGRVRVVIPAELVRSMEAEQLDGILAHELAHIRRCDHVVRWLEWLTCVACWWNPLAWWARKGLRHNEEICCDALVLARLKSNPRTYASSLLTAIEFLSAQALRPPALASGMDGSGSLEWRFKMIVSTKPLRETPCWLRALALLCVLAILPLGIAYAGEDQDDGGAKPTREEMAKVKEEIWAHVKSGEITEEQAQERWQGYLRHVKAKRAKMAAEMKLRKEMAAFHQKLEDAVKAGEITEEEAKAKWKAYEQSVHDTRDKKRDKKHADFEAMNRRILEAVRRGDLTEEEGRRKLEEIRRRMAAGEKKKHADFEAMNRRILEAVRRGDLTEEEGRRKLEEIRRRMAAGEEKRDKDHADFEALSRRIQEAVRRGDLTEEEGRRKLEEIRRRMAAGEQKRDEGKR